ncbi:DoxX family protein [Flectobacillus roseus]|uniref:DoxX family protein n=1 Tax=Flectobacillus roseus TaxID=502259 RepID=A0ABT6Y436_9BACT|nr:DoxX family protein [Flectobacillus roseus]MDI9858329.1 DoxX family protein [Flectobacillus roseus]
MTTFKQNTKFKTLITWILQILLAASLTYGGLMKLVTPVDQLAQIWPWVSQVPSQLLWGTAIVDLLGAVGIVLPKLFQIKPQLSRWTAYGILGLMLSAIIFHVVRDEGKVIGFNIFLMILTLILLKLWKSE